MRAHYLIADGTFRQLTGDHEGALRQLRQAEQAAEGQDAPVLEYEIARSRARALRALGHSAEANRQAFIALRLATDGEWEHRARRIRAEFGVGGSSSESAPVSISGELNRRRLEALQQVSLASATVLDTQELARVALDEMLRILGAERAFLFLVDDDTHALVPRLGRDSSGDDLDTLTGYSTTLIDRVHADGQPLITTSDQAGQVMRSESVTALGLLSVMIAPLQLKGRLRGIVYLDSRVAKGMFTIDDVDILSAIGSQLAVSLETAHAAALEAAVRVAQQQRDLAEMLRSAMSNLSQTLNPDEVLRLLLVTAARLVHADAACLLQHGDDKLRVAFVDGSVDDGSVGLIVDVGADRTLAAVIAGGVPVQGTRAVERPAPLPHVLRDIRSWIAVPLAQRGEVVGLLFVASGSEHGFTEADLEIEAALAAQGMVAYETACLFDQVRELAAKDGLTGIYNRRHLIEQAKRRLAAARADRQGLAALMIDIDNFKAVNDRYGHSVGDEVIRESLYGYDSLCGMGISLDATAARNSSSSRIATTRSCRLSGSGSRSGVPR